MHSLWQVFGVGRQTAERLVEQCFHLLDGPLGHHAAVGAHDDDPAERAPWEAACRPGPPAAGPRRARCWAWPRWHHCHTEPPMRFQRLSSSADTCRDGSTPKPMRAQREPSASSLNNGSDAGRRTQPCGRVAPARSRWLPATAEQAAVERVLRLDLQVVEQRTRERQHAERRIVPWITKALRRLRGITSAPRNLARLMIFLACGRRSSS